MARTSVDISMEKLDKVRGILGTESFRETSNAAFRKAIRIAAVRGLVALGEAGAF
jgi:Arc/MetJ family transcription regulator